MAYWRVKLIVTMTIQCTIYQTFLQHYFLVNFVNQFRQVFRLQSWFNFEIWLMDSQLLFFHVTSTNGTITTPQTNNCARKPGQRKHVRNAKTFSSKKSKLNDCWILLKLVKFCAYHDHIWNLFRLPGMTCCPLLTDGEVEIGFWAGYIFILFYLEHRNI
jgi:hypothetical protein